MSENQSVKFKCKVCGDNMTLSSKHVSKADCEAVLLNAGWVDMKMGRGLLCHACKIKEDTRQMNLYELAPKHLEGW